DAIGLSGLITPSLDEMVNVAKEMERRQLKIPLLIGGATTSKQHTAVRIAPAYSEPTLHVLDASRVVGVVSDLLDPVRGGILDRAFFFHAWELRGRFPAILDHPQMGPAARELYENAQQLLDEIVNDRKLRARGVYGFWAAQAEGDDLLLENGVRFPMLRQQVE